MVSHPGVLLSAVLVLVTLVAERSLTGSVFTGSGTLGGGALVPAWGGASDLWREYLAGYHATGIGSAASAPPYLAVIAVLASLLGGKAWLATDLLLLGCVPAAGVTAFYATRRVTPVLAASRVWIAASYALLPVAMGAVAAGQARHRGRLRPAPAHRHHDRADTHHRGHAVPPAAARAWAAGLLITAVAAAFVPLAWPVAVIAASWGRSWRWP